MGYWRVFVGAVEVLLLFAAVSGLVIGFSWAVLVLVSLCFPLVGKRGRTRRDGDSPNAQDDSRTD